MRTKKKEPSAEELLDAMNRMYDTEDMNKTSVVLKSKARGPEFGCLPCKYEFDRAGKASPNRCPKCKSEIIYKKWEDLSEEAKAKKYTPDIEDQIMGPKQDKYFHARQVRATRKG